MADRRHIWLLLLLWLVTACSQPAVTPPDTIVFDTTAVLDLETREALTSFDASSGELRFLTLTSQLAELAPGDVLVSEPSPGAPHGFLRKLVEVRQEGDEVVAVTAVAALTEAIERGHLEAAAQFGADDLLATESYHSGVTLGAYALDDDANVGALPGYAFYLRFDETLLDIDTNNANLKVEVHGEVNMNMGFNLSADISPCFEVPPVCVDGVRATLGFDEHVSITVSGEAKVKLAHDIKVGQYYFKPIVTFIGPVPVVIVPTVAVYLGASGAVNLTFSYGVSERATAQLGARWNGDNWENISGFDFYLDGVDHIDVGGALSARLYVRPTAAMLLYGVAGFTATLEPGLEMSAQPDRDPFWKLDGYLRGTVGIGLDLPLAGHLANYDVELFNVRRELRRSPNLPPRISIFASPARADLTRPYTLLALVDDLEGRRLCGAFFCIQDPEGGPLDVTLRSDREGPLPIAEPYGFRVAGRHTVNITVTDSAGNVVQDFLTLDVVNAPPDLIVIGTPVSTTPQGVQWFLSAQADDVNSGPLPCSALRWVVSSPDALVTDLGASVGCNVYAIFGREGPRSVGLSASDPQGLRSTRTFDVDVTEPPAVLPPIIGFMQVTDRDTGAAIGADDEVVEGQVLRFFMPVSNPDGQPLDFWWSYQIDAQSNTTPPIRCQPTEGDYGYQGQFFFAFFDCGDTHPAMRGTWTMTVEVGPVRQSRAIAIYAPSRGGPR